MPVPTSKTTVAGPQTSEAACAQNSLMRFTRSLEDGPPVESFSDHLVLLHGASFKQPLEPIRFEPLVLARHLCLAERSEAQGSTIRTRFWMGRMYEKWGCLSSKKDASLQISIDTSGEIR